MNLWVRNSGLIILSALSFFSCEEELSTVGLPPENDLGIFFVDVPLADKVSQIWVDSLNSRGSNSILTGSYQDPYFGRIEAMNFSEFTLPKADPGDDLKDKTIEFDSLVLETRIRGMYGDDVSTTPQKIEIYQLTDTIPVITKRLTTATSQPIGLKLAESQFMLDPDSVNLKFSDTGRDENMDALDSAYREKYFDNNDIYIYKSTFRFDASFAQDFYSKMITSDQTFESAKNFADYFKGLAFVPVEGNSAIITYGTSDTRLVLYYTETDDNGNKTQGRMGFPVANLFQASSISYNYIKPNNHTPWEGSDFDDLTNFYEPYTSNTGLAYVQAGTNLLMKLDLSDFKIFADTVKNPIIQHAELVLENLQGVKKSAPVPTSLTYYLTNNDSIAKSKYRTTFLVDNNSRPVEANYNEEDNVIRNNITLALQNFLRNNDHDQLIMAPVIFGGNNAVVPDASNTSRLVVGKDDIHIRLYYTIPDKSK